MSLSWVKGVDSDNPDDEFLIAASGEEGELVETFTQTFWGAGTTTIPHVVGG